MPTIPENPVAVITIYGHQPAPDEALLGIRDYLKEAIAKIPGVVPRPEEVVVLIDNVQGPDDKGIFARIRAPMLHLHTDAHIQRVMQTAEDVVCRCLPNQQWWAVS